MIKKFTIAFLISLIVPAVLFSSGEKPRFKKKEHVKLAGLIGGHAMAIDAYYEICLQKGVRTDNYLRGIDKLFKKKWGMSFSKMKLKMEERSGRDFREESHRLVNYAIKKKNGCNTSGMEEWFNYMFKMYGKSLDKFHAIK